MNSTKLSLSTIVTIAIVGVLLVAGGFLIGTFVPAIFPPQASAESKQIDQLFHILLIIGGAIFLLVQGLLIYSVLRFRARPGDSSDGIHLHGNTTLEIVWTAIPAVIVAVLAILSWQVWSDLQTPKTNEVAVQVDARRFSWGFTYDAPLTVMPEVVDLAKLPENVRVDAEDDGALTISSGDLYTFVGQSVVLAMQPQDVIHSFWVPAFRIKQDVIPGRETSVRFTVVEANDGQTYPKRYAIRCAELCGANHGLMISNVVVYENEATFLNDWLIPQMDSKMHPPADPVLRGEQILTGDTVKCNTCHVESNLGWAPAAPLGPSLNGVADRAVGSRSTATGLSGVDYLHQAIADPAVYVVPGFTPLMPPNQLPSDCDIQAVVAYLCTQSDSGTPACTIDLGKYQAECVAGGAESSSEATSEATSELISTPVSEATSEATAAPVGEATQEATVEPTAGS